MSLPTPLLVTARLASPLAHEPPRLDALLEWAVAPFFLEKDPRAVEPWKIDRTRPAPPAGILPTGLVRRQLGPWPVALCSDPILSAGAPETVEHVNKRLAVECAVLLAPAERKIVSTTNSWTKSYRLPLRVRAVSCVRWFAVGNRREIWKLLKRVTSLSKKRSDGYGRIARWEIDPVPADYSWFAPHPAGQVLMRTLPAGPWLPPGLLGVRKDFGACVAPYWHPDRYCEVVTPC